MSPCAGGTARIMDTVINRDDSDFKGGALPYGDAMNTGGSNVEILTRVELDLAFASEKLLNLEMLVMEIARRATDFEPATFEDESVSSETAENAFELDILYGILDAEVKELTNLISSLQADIESIEHRVLKEESGGKVKAKLDAATMTLKQMQELIADIRNESAKFEKAIQFFHETEGKYSLLDCLYMNQICPYRTACLQGLKVLDVKMAICHIKLVWRQKINTEMFCIC